MWLPLIVIVGLFGAFKGSQKFESEESKNQHAIYYAQLAAGEDRAIEQCVAMERMHIADQQEADNNAIAIKRIPIQK